MLNMEVEVHWMCGANVNDLVNYSLDPVGNWLFDNSTLHGVNSGLFSFNPDDWLMAETYDNNGNVVTSRAKIFTYDSENHLTSMNGGYVTLQYDGDGNRVCETVSGVTTRYLVDDLNPTGYAQVVEELSGGSVQRAYTYGLQRISEDQLINKAWTPSFYNYDGGGTVRQLTSLAGSVTDTYSYDAFGNLLASTGATPNNYLYRAEQYDSDLGLYYLRARFYNPFTGRFLSRDPEDGEAAAPATLHKYMYAGGDPVNLADPTGRAQARAGTISGGLGEYTGLITVIALQTVPVVRAVESELACALAADATRFSSEIINGLEWQGTADVYQSSKCTWTLKKKKSCRESHPGAPVNYVYAAITPAIAAHIELAQATGSPDWLHYLGPRNPLQRINRREACGDITLYKGLECDEYPYASTLEGGWGASIAPVPGQEQRIQGGQLGGFYSGLAPGEGFCVEVVE